MTQPPPIVPGPNSQPEPPPPQVIYVHKSSDTVGRAAIGTVTVILILIGVLCVLPALLCGFLGFLGSPTTH